MAGAELSRLNKIYVKVSAITDTTGYMRPQSILWENGRTLTIQEIRDFRPASAFDSSSDCYVILVDGQEKHLFFEHTPLFPGRFGRWYVLSASPDS